MRMKHRPVLWLPDDAVVHPDLIWLIFATARPTVSQAPVVVLYAREPIRSHGCNGPGCVRDSIDSYHAAERLCVADETQGRREQTGNEVQALP